MEETVTWIRQTKRFTNRNQLLQANKSTLLDVGRIHLYVFSRWLMEPLTVGTEREPSDWINGQKKGKKPAIDWLIQIIDDPGHGGFIPNWFVQDDLKKKGPTLWQHLDFSSISKWISVELTSPLPAKTPLIKTINKTSDLVHLLVNPDQEKMKTWYVPDVTDI